MNSTSLITGKMCYKTVSYTHLDVYKRQVIIPDIIFWNKQDIDWDAVKEYLKKYLGEIIENKQTKEKIEIGKMCIRDSIYPVITNNNVHIFHSCL